MNEKQKAALLLAAELNNMSAGHHNKCKSMLENLQSYGPAELPAVMAKLRALLFAVDDWQLKANGQIIAAINDADYPA